MYISQILTRLNEKINITSLIFKISIFIDSSTFWMLYQFPASPLKFVSSYAWLSQGVMNYTLALSQETREKENMTFHTITSLH